jgi:hypothetical protein
MFWIKNNGNNFGGWKNQTQFFFMEEPLKIENADNTSFACLLKKLARPTKQHSPNEEKINNLNGQVPKSVLAWA